MPRAEGQSQTATAGRRILEWRGTKRRRSDGVGHQGTCLTREPELHGGDHQDDDEQRVGHRRGVAGVELHERAVPQVVDDDGGGAQRSAACGDVDLVEELQRVDRQPDQHEQVRRAEQRHGDGPEPGERGRSVDRGRLVQLGRNTLQRGQIHDHREARPAPDRHRDDHEQRLRRRRQERLRGYADGIQSSVDQTVVAVGQPQEDDALRDGRHRHGDVGGRPVDRDETHRAVQRGGDEQPDDHRAGHEQRRVDDGVLDRLHEDRVVGQLLVVVEADPRRLVAEQVGLLERQLQRHQHRQQAEDTDQDGRRADQRPSRHGVCAAQPPNQCGHRLPTSRPASRLRPGRRRQGRPWAVPCRA